MGKMPYCCCMTPNEELNKQVSMAIISSKLDPSDRMYECITLRCAKWYSKRTLALAIESMVPTKTKGTRPSSRGCVGFGSLSPSILTRTTLLLSTISWMTRPFLPITLPTRKRGTWIDSSPYSSIPRAFRTDSSIYNIKAIIPIN